MVKFGRNKLKALNKLTKKQNASSNNPTNKILKKKLNVEKKVTFQKEILLKETAKSESLVKNVTKTDIALKKLMKKPEVTKQKIDTEAKPKLRSVPKQKKRQKMQLSDTQLLKSLMNKKK